MARPHPPEFRRRAVELANQRDERSERVTPVATLNCPGICGGSRPWK
jgi:hypothetical protein